MKKSLFYMLILLSIVFALTGCLPKTAGQEPPVPVVSFKAYLPENTPDDATIYIIGNYCNWDFDSAATSTVKIDIEEKKYAEFELQVAEFPLEYKYTVGPDWEYVEVKADGNDLDDNRKIDSAPEGVVIDTVAKWAAIPTPPSEEPTKVNIKAYLPENTPDDATIYIIGNYCNWDFGGAKTSDVQTDDEGKKYAEFELQIAEFPLEYKYTVGPDWEYVEKDAEGVEIGDRVIESAPEEVVIDTVASWAAIPTPPSEEEIIIDGNFSDWESYEGTKKILEDSANDSKWGEENDVNWLGIAADEEFLYIGAQYKASNNGFIVYISIEGDDTGAKNMNFGGWSRAIKFDRNVQYFVASWEHQDPQLWQVENTQTKTEKSSLISDKYVKQNEGYEIKIPLSELGLESGNKIYFVGCIVGGDGYSSGDTAPDNPPVQDSVIINTIDNMSTFTIP